MKIKILFVCLGNICRSPMAEAILKDKISSAGLKDKILVDSAGTADYHIGDAPDHRTLAVLSENKIHFKHLGRQVTRLDADQFDYIIAMDRSNYNDLKKLLPSSFTNLWLMRENDLLLPGSDVPDPYYGSIEDFRKTYEILDQNINSLISTIREKHAI